MHWSEPKFIEVMDDPTTVNVWAPEFFWDEDRQQAMVVWASCVPSQHFALGIEDEKNNHRLYYSVTKDFKTWTKGKLLIDPGFSCIDATLLKRGKNDYVMVLKDNTRNARNVKVAFAKNPMGPWSKASEPFTGNFMEGPTPSNCLRTVRWAMVISFITTVTASSISALILPRISFISPM